VVRELGVVMARPAVSRGLACTVAATSFGASLEAEFHALRTATTRAVTVRLDGTGMDTPGGMLAGVEVM